MLDLRCGLGLGLGLLGFRLPFGGRLQGTGFGLGFRVDFSLRNAGFGPFVSRLRSLEFGMGFGAG